VSDDGQIFLSGLKLKGEINAQWGKPARPALFRPHTLPEAA
jgi:outer membrane usher protein FimD/PapC